MMKILSIKHNSNLFVFRVRCEKTAMEQRDNIKFYVKLHKTIIHEVYIEETIEIVKFFMS